MNVLIADKFEKSGVEGLTNLGCRVTVEAGVGAEKLGVALAQTQAEVLIVRSTKVLKSAIEQAGPLKLIVRAGSGVDNIDVPAATARKIAVCNCPGMNAVAVAELTLGLLLCCDRRIADQCAMARDGAWSKKEFSKTTTDGTGARGLKGLTLGVVGVGHIGQEVIKRANAFGMRVVTWSRGITPQHAAALNCEFGGTDTPALLRLAARADAISVHLPLADSTKKLFGKEFFDAMRPGSYFINTSRAGVVDEAALRHAITTKRIRAGLDVADNQPAETEGAWESVTSKLPGVYFTHHCGASTDQAQQAVAEEAVRVVKVFKEIGVAENCVNPA